MFLFKRQTQQPYSKQELFLFYNKLVEQARQPYFYKELNIPDTVEGRFEMILLHVFVPIHLFKGKSETDDQFCQDLFDAFFADMDRNLREMGVGDLSVGKKVKKLAESFYGRAFAYEEALSLPEPNLTKTLTKTILKNIYDSNESVLREAKSLAVYTKSQVELFKSETFSSLMDINPLYPLNFLENSNKTH